MLFFFFFQAEDGIRDAQESRGLGDVYKRQAPRNASPPQPAKRPAAPKRRPSHSPVQDSAATVEMNAQPPAPLEARRRTIADRAHIQMQRRKRRGTQPTDQDPEDTPLRSENLSSSSLAPGTLLQADDDSGGAQLKRVRTISDILKMPGRDSRDRRMTLALLQEAKDAENQRNFSVSGEKKKQEQSEAVLDAFRAMLCITSPTGEEVDLEGDWETSVDAQLPLPAAMQPEESNRRLVNAASQGGARGKLAMVIMRALAVGKMQRLLKLQRAKPEEEEVVEAELQAVEEAAPTQPKTPPAKKRGVLDMEEVNRLLRLEVESRREEDERAAATNMSPLLTADVTPRGGTSAWVGHLPKFKDAHNDSITLATPELMTVISEPDSNPSPLGIQSPTKLYGESTEMGSSESLFGIKQVHTDSTPASEAATVDDVILIHERIHEFARITFAASGVDLRSGAGTTKDGDSVLSLPERGRRAYLRSLEMLEAHFFFHPDAMFKDDTKSALRKKIGGHMGLNNSADDGSGGGGGSGSNTPVPEHMLMKHAKSVPTSVFDVLEVSADLVMSLLEQVKEFNLNQHLDAVIIPVSYTHLTLPTKRIV
eukprot:TRINITY_DN15908_c0_g1_i2.p1 TRINITY_DN15908_c0_g1~~TRINITY_DN15908_c0_g1_i2.p1  ORF type:complete len:595 (+),score=124.14 TRINITY_DN15908_c0_g1_i2:49-1833(+)